MNRGTMCCTSDFKRDYTRFSKGGFRGGGRRSVPPFLAPPAERQRSFSNTDLSVVRLSVCPSVKIEGGEGSISETLQ